MPVPNTAKDSRTDPSIARRPQTRLWVQQQKRLAREGASLDKHKDDFTKRIKQVLASKSDLDQLGRQQPPSGSNSRPQVKSRQKETGLPQYQRTRSQETAVRRWLVSIDRPRSRISGAQSQELSGTRMDSSSTPSGVSTEASEASLRPISAATTDKTEKPAKNPRYSVTWESLRMRQVDQTESDDDLAGHFLSVLSPKPIRVKFKDTGELQTILRDFLHLCEHSRPTNDSYAAIEKLVDKIAHWKPQHSLFAISKQEFDLDIRLCRNSNEAVFQRTVMTALIDRWHLSDLFTFNCEGQWITADYPLPTTGQTEKISVPKPDLAVFFKFEALASKISVPVPTRLNECLRPDGGQWRCFPFLFIEAKRADHSLQQATLANAHSASQALYNIYIWMAIAGQHNDFFAKIRVFTIELNARELALRCYRASMDDDNQIRFQYHEVQSQQLYHRDEACTLIRNIMQNYGAQELYETLRNVFQKVTSAYVAGQLDVPLGRRSKRKANLPSGQFDKRSRGAGTSINTVDISQSFGAGDLSLSSTNT